MDNFYAEHLKSTQLFLVDNEGKWRPTIDSMCAPDPWKDEPDKIIAIVDGKPVDVEIVSSGHNKVYFSDDGGDCEIMYTFNLVANGNIVGTCSYCEY